MLKLIDFCYKYLLTLIILNVSVHLGAQEKAPSFYYSNNVGIDLGINHLTNQAVNIREIEFPENI